jgi:hypothetical protein
MRKQAAEMIGEIIAAGPRTAKDGTVYGVAELILLAVLGEFCPDLVRVTGTTQV